MKITRILFNTDGGFTPSKAFGRTSWIAVGGESRVFGQTNEVARSAEETVTGVLVTAADGSVHKYPWHTIDKLEFGEAAPVEVKRGPGRPKSEVAA